MTTAVERNRDKLKKFKWQRHMCLDTEDGGFIHDTCKALKAHRICRTPRVKGRYGTGVVTYCIDGEDKEYETIEEFVQALEDKGLLES